MVTLSERMKQYEGISKTVLMPNMPVIVRVDGRAFHTYTKKFKKPYDERLAKAMTDTTEFLCKNIPGCVMGYTQSDEISLVLTDYKTYDTTAWLSYEVQKLCSIIASMATLQFYRSIAEQIEEPTKGTPTFDARVFSIPTHEVNNYFIWRQQDCIRNSITTHARSLYTHKELEGRNSAVKLEMMFDAGLDWNALDTRVKYGVVWYKADNREERCKWRTATETPLFNEDKQFVEDIMTRL